jgi:demethylmenaquinone methyltransferase/2-methoxy-6-polyprenyl-1,4-benzoquinol methylase
VPATRLPVDARSSERARRVFATLPARYDLLAELLSFGQNGRWRRAAIEAALRDDPELVCDVATGTAGVAVDLVRRARSRHPGELGPEVVGIDLSPQMLATGRRRVAAAHLDDRISLVLARGERLPLPDASVDALTFTYLLRYVADPAATVAELARVVRPGGRMSSLEFHVPPRFGWRIAWRAYTRLVLPVAGGLLGGRGWWRVGAFLGPNIDDHYRRHPLADHVRWWHEAGLEDVEVQVMSLGGGLVMSGRRRA